MIRKESHYGSTTLHAACGNQASIDVVLMLIEIGGRELVLNNEQLCGHTVLHIACKNRGSIEVVSKLLETGGALTSLLQKNVVRDILHYILHVKMELRSKSLQSSWRLEAQRYLYKRIKMVTMRFLFVWSVLSMYLVIRSFSWQRNTFQHKLKENLELGACSILYPFNTQNQIYRSWEEFAPWLEMAIDDSDSPPPIL